MKIKIKNIRINKITGLGKISFPSGIGKILIFKAIAKIPACIKITKIFERWRGHYFNNQNMKLGGEYFV